MLPCFSFILLSLFPAVDADLRYKYQEAIARHYNEVRPDRGDLFEKAKNNPKTHEILRRVGWRGHSRDGLDRHSAPHTRQMDPGCEVIKGGTGNTNAMCLFVSLTAPFPYYVTANSPC